MITADPQRRVSTLARILDHIGRTAPQADRDLLLAIAPVVYGEMPDPLALRLSPEAVAARLAGIFRFVARTMPPAVQLYKGLPGLHVTVRNPDDDEARAEGSTHEVTIVETHSPDAPFIYESLKNYFQKEGLRVFSSIHPIFTVRRQWERESSRLAPGARCSASCTHSGSTSSSACSPITASRISASS